MSAAAWDHIVVAVAPVQEGLRCELRDGRTILLGPEWRGEISITDRLHTAADVLAVDRLTPLYVERRNRLDVAQIRIEAAHSPRRNRLGRGFVLLDAVSGFSGIAKVLITCEQIRDYFFAPNRTANWSDQPTWFEVLGVRENAAPAEIRVAYRVRLLELRARGDESSRVLERQLSRGLEILLDPRLRKAYLSLLENANADVPFPPWTVGCVRATGQKQGDLFVVRTLLKFSAQAEQQTIRLALRRFRFEDQCAVYRDARRGILIRLDPAVLPMQWTEQSNIWAHLALGSATVEAAFWQETRFRRTQKGFEPKHWWQPFQSTVRLQDPEVAARRFEAARLFWEHFHPHADIVALLRGKLEQQPMELRRAAEWCVARGVREPVEARWINWEPDYDEAYYRALAARANAIYLFRNEYLFVFDQTVVSEIPQSGHATYIFHPSASLETFLCAYSKTTRHAIRTDAMAARASLGYAGRIPHLKDISAWIAKIEQTFLSPIARRISKEVVSHEDKASGAPVSSPSMAVANER